MTRSSIAPSLFVILSALLMLAPLAGCGDTHSPGEDVGMAAEDAGDGGDGGPLDAAADAPVPEDASVARICSPGSVSCDGDTPRRCDDDGLGYTSLSPCGSDLHCQPETGACVTSCALATSSGDAIGCEYWATQLSNASLPDEFDFGVVVPNTSTTPLTVEVHRGSRMILSETVAPGDNGTFALPSIPELRGTRDDLAPALVAGGGYRVTTSRPAPVYQFSSLGEHVAMDCADPFSDLALDDMCSAHTTDATALVPTHALGSRYLAVSWPSDALEFEDSFLTELDPLPASLSVVAVDPGQSEVTIEFASHARLFYEGLSTWANPGDSRTFRLHQSQVLVVLGGTGGCADPTPWQDWGDSSRHRIRYCPGGADSDLTGSTIEAADGKRLAVFGGADCAMVPLGNWACDHMEASVPPVASWGRRYVVAPAGAPDRPADVVRVLSAANGNRVTFDPPSVHGPVTLDEGQSLEVRAEVAFEVRGSQSMMVSQYMTGIPLNASVEGDGDPAMTLLTPVAGYRRSYEVAARAEFGPTFALLTAPAGTAVFIDGVEVTGWVPVAASMQTTRVSLDVGPRRLESSGPFGVVVGGAAPSVAYLYTPRGS